LHASPDRTQLASRVELGGAFAISVGVVVVVAVTVSWGDFPLQMCEYLPSNWHVWSYSQHWLPFDLVLPQYPPDGTQERLSP
jgi:hypothetical protein